MVIKYKILPVLAVGLIAAIALPEAASAEGTVPALNTCASTQAAVSGAPSLDAQLLPTAPADMSEFASQGEFGIQQVAKLAALPDLESGMEAALDADDQTDLSENDELATVADALDPSANQAFTSAQQAAVTTFALQNANADPAAVNAAVKAGYSAAVDEVITGDQPIANNVVDQPDATTLDPVSAPSSTLCLANDLADRPVNTALAQDLQLGNQINQDLSPEAENVADARLVAPPAGDISRTDIKIDRSGIAKENAADDANQAAKHASDEAAKRNADPVAKAAPPAKQAAIARPTKAVLPKQAATIAKKRKLQQPQRRAVTRTRVQGQCSRVRTRRQLRARRNITDVSLLAPPVGDISRTDIDKNTAINQASQAANNAIIKPAPAAPAKQADTAPPAPSTKATVDQKPVVAQPTVQGQCSRVRTGIRQGTGNGATRRRRVRNDGATLALQDVKQAARTCANQVAVLRLEEAGDD